ncbi:hypothetical protein [Kribbella monticola]|uniref:hypothetical protein n=1 Tax=Kribbella monticola TaxID=2185285 RepID=UPI0013005BE7|nr:hypothetical protein [Kribbella monticola]
MSEHDQAIGTMIRRRWPATAGWWRRDGRSSAQVERAGALLMSECDEAAWW